MTPDAGTIEPWLRWVFLIHMAATLWMANMIWFVQIVHYPLFDQVGRPEFVAYERRHVRLTGRVVVLPMLIEAASAALLFQLRPPGLPVGPQLAGLGLIGIIWLSTLSAQIPAHARLVHGFDLAVHRRLVGSNWIRTIAWTGRAVLVLLLGERFL